MNSPQILLIDSDSGNNSVVETYIAFREAKNMGMDLILLTRNAELPVCKYGDYGRLHYEQEKRQKENKQKVQKLKTLRVRPCTQAHDLDIEVRKATEFIKKGDKVRIECRFKSREIEHPELGLSNINYIIEKLGDAVKIDKAPELMGKIMSIVVSPNL